MKLPVKNQQKNQLINKAVRFLSHRPRSIHEVRQKLLQSSSNLELVEEVVEQLIELKLLNDDSFTEWLIHSRVSNTLKGPNFIRQELKKFGIPKDLAAKHISAVDKKDLVQSALKLLDKKHPNPLSDFKTTQKLKRYLYSRGYTSQTISSAIDEKASRQ